MPFSDPVSVMAHPWQVPVQALSQQKPSAQKPLRHWSVALHAVPWSALARQEPVLQWLLDDAQSVSAPHVVKHAVALAQIKPPGQGCVVPAVQVPVPLHVPSWVRMAPVHVAVPHVVAVDACSHAPAPSHLPSLPHVELTAHCPVGAAIPAE